MLIQTFILKQRSILFRNMDIFLANSSVLTELYVAFVYIVTTTVVSMNAETAFLVHLIEACS